MKNLLEQIKSRTNELSTSNSVRFNTNDFLLELLLDKEMSRNDIIDHIISKRIEISGVDVEKMKSDDLNELIDKFYKTSKNGLDTSVSDSNNNSSFSYNKAYEDYELIKKGGMLSIKKRSTKESK